MKELINSQGERFQFTKLTGFFFTYLYYSLQYYCLHVSAIIKVVHNQFLDIYFDVNIFLKCPSTELSCKVVFINSSTLFDLFHWNTAFSLVIWIRMKPDCIQFFLDLAIRPGGCLNYQKSCLVHLLYLYHAYVPSINCTVICASWS